jgi:hypothetical protein
MKGILQFDLPEEREDFEHAQKATHYVAIIEDLFNLLRQKSKYENKKSIAITELQEWLRSELDE